jgi:hypothetical protein
MQDRINSTTRRSACRALLPAIAVAALLAGLPTAQAADQQATGAEMDNTINWHVARGSNMSGAYAQAPVHHRQATGAEGDNAANWARVTGVSAAR